MFFTFWVHPVLPVPGMLSFSELDKTSISQLKNKKIKKNTFYCNVADIWVIWPRRDRWLLSFISGKKNDVRIFKMIRIEDDLGERRTWRGSSQKVVVESLILLGIGHFLGYLGWLELGLLKVNPLKTVFFLFSRPSGMWDAIML